MYLRYSDSKSTNFEGEKDEEKNKSKLSESEEKEEDEGEPVAKVNLCTYKSKGGFRIQRKV